MYRNLVVIPARMASTRLPDKPLADIHGTPMIVHVWHQAMAAQMGRVIVATDSEDIATVIRDAGGEAVMTRDDHASGSDRIFEALSHVDPEEEIDFVINLQGDLPNLDPKLIHTCLQPLLDTAPRARSVHNRGVHDVQAHISTLAAQIMDDEERDNPNVVKLIGTPVSLSRTNNADKDQATPTRLRALYFTRASAPHGEGPLYHHIGIYAYHRSALERFVSLPASPLETREKLEQLRALENGMRIDVAIVDTIPLGVDTPQDLERARAIMAPGKKADA